MSTSKVLIGHVLDRLRDLPDGAVQMIATSPPYLGLRDYGLEPVIWEPVVYAPMAGLPDLRVPAHADPEAFVDCDHDWGEWLDRRDVREEAVHGKTRTTDRFYGDESRRFDGNHQKHAHGQFCRKCGAWRGCLGLEDDPNLYIGHLVQIFREARRVLSNDGVLWLNLGDSYARNGGTDARISPSANVGNSKNTLKLKGSRKQRAPVGLKSKDLLGIPWRAALALQADGWYLRSDVVWAKGVSLAQTWHGNPMPESVTDRPTRAHEMVFLLSKRERYFFDHVAIRECAASQPSRKGSSFRREGSKRAHAGTHAMLSMPTHRQDRPDLQYNGPLRNMRDVWCVTTQPYPGAHFAVWPEALVRPMVLAGTSAAGHCPKCGKRWRRVVRERAPKGSGGGNHLAQRRVGRDQWTAQCCCGVPAVTDVVLDIFGGSGTTAAVAVAEGRQAWLIEANPAYAPLQDERLKKQRERGRPVSRTPKALGGNPMPEPEQGHLFAEGFGLGCDNHQAHETYPEVGEIQEVLP